MPARPRCAPRPSPPPAPAAGCRRNSVCGCAGRSGRPRCRVSYGAVSALVPIPDHIETLLLLLDGTLLDSASDTHVGFEVVPEYYGRTRGLSGREALEQEIQARPRSAEGTLNWY